AEAAERAAGLDPVAELEPFEQGRGGAAGDVADRDLDRRLRAQRLFTPGRQRIRTPGRRAVAVMEVHLQELSRHEVQCLTIVPDEAEVGDARREHPSRGEPEGELDDGHLPILKASPRAPRPWKPP